MDDEELSVFEFLAQSTEARITHYRHRAAEFRVQAETVPTSRRKALLELAKKFDRLADRITMDRRA
jgi:hypothetical protein